MTMNTVLLVEDDPSIHQFVRAALALYHVRTAPSVSVALDEIGRESIDLLLLDLHLGIDSNGLRIAQYLREKQPYAALVILTGQGTLETAIKAIEVGADAYLLKPVAPDKLRETVREQIDKMQERRRRDELANYMEAAVSAMQHSANTPMPGSVLVSGKVMMDRARYEALYDGNNLDLSPAQFRTLWALVDAEGEPVDPVHLVQEALGYKTSEIEARELIKGYISQIRRKLAAYDSEREFIRTIRGHGYLWIRPD